MRTSINLPDEVIATVRDRAAADGITPAEWMRRAILEAVTPRHPDEHPAGTPGNTPDETPISSRDGTIARADVLAADLDTLRTRADQAEAVAAERLTRIALLRADNARLAATVAAVRKSVSPTIPPRISAAAARNTADVLTVAHPRIVVKNGMIYEESW